MSENDQFFTGSFESLFKYWQNPERAKKFTKGGTRVQAIRYFLNRSEVEIHKGTWIDTAIGAGFIQKQIYHTVEPTFLVGVDFSREMLNLVDEPVERILGSSFDLPFRTNSANMTSNIFCLSDYPDPSKALHELSRITATRGVMFFMDYSDQDEYWQIRQGNHKDHEVIGNINLRGTDTILEFLPNGMRVVQNIIIEYEVETAEFDQRIKLPEKLKRAFLFVELYKPKSFEN